MINREHYGMLWYFLEPSIVSFQKEESDFCLFILRLVILLISETHSEKVTIGSSFCMNFFLYLLLCMNFFSWHFPWHELFFGFFPTPPPPPPATHHSSNGPSLSVHWQFPDIKKMLKFFVHTINYKG